MLTCDVAPDARHLHAGHAPGPPLLQGCLDVQPGVRYAEPEGCVARTKKSRTLQVEAAHFWKQFTTGHVHAFLQNRPFGENLISPRQELCLTRRKAGENFWNVPADFESTVTAAG